MKAGFLILSVLGLIVLANSTGNTGRVMSLQKKGWTEIFNENYMEKWETVLEKESYWPPTIGDIGDGDDQKEVAVSLYRELSFGGERL